jgi:hypothetical protein
MTLDDNLRGVHPTLELRIRGLLSEPGLEAYGTYPAVRTYSKQKYLFDGWKSGKRGFNTAADPDRVLLTGPNFPYDWKPRGSWHMIQSDGYGHAVDLKRPWYVTRAQADRAIKPYLQKWGLMQTALNVGEWWHLQALTSQGWVPGPLPSSGDEMFITRDERNDEYHVHVAGLGSAAVDSPAHWQEVIAQGRLTGTYSSPHMAALYEKIAKQSA